NRGPRWHSRSRQTDHIAEATTHRRGDGRGSLIPLYHTDRSRRSRDSEIRWASDRERDSSRLLKTSATASNGKGITARRSARADCDRHRGGACTVLAYTTLFRSNRGPRWHSRSRQTDRAAEATTHRRGDSRGSLISLYHTDRSRRSRDC